jgi:hypothetical protein
MVDKIRRREMRKKRRKKVSHDGAIFDGGIRMIAASLLFGISSVNHNNI